MYEPDVIRTANSPRYHPNLFACKFLCSAIFLGDKSDKGYKDHKGYISYGY